jgi:hypothetical protein
MKDPITVVLGHVEPAGVGDRSPTSLEETMPGSSRRAAALLVAGSLIGAITLSGCAADDGDGAPAGASGSPSAGQSDEPVVVDFVIDNNQVSPTVNRVPVESGDSVRLSVTSDVADSIHVHGVELTLVLEAGVKGVLEFVVPPGIQHNVYPVEGHNSGLILFELRVR